MGDIYMVFGLLNRAARPSVMSRDSSTPDLDLSSNNLPYNTSRVPLRGLRARLLGGASSFAVPAASMALTLGVALSGEASAQTIIGPQTSTYNLNAANNPFLINSGTTVNAPAGNAIYGNTAGTNWTITNNGAVTGQTNGIDLQQIGTVTNAGTITGTRGSGEGVYLQAGGSVTNQTGGTISGGGVGVFVFSGAGAVTNAGAITGTGRYGVNLNDGGSVTNQTGGVISGGIVGVSVFTAAGTVTNAGVITGINRYGVYLHAGGSVTNQTGGLISGVNIANAAGTVTNAGTITGIGTNSVQFAGTGANTLTLQTGSVLNGTAIGSTAAGATNALVLQGTGTANNNFVNFNTLDVQASGAWTLGGTANIGTATVASGGTLTVSGQLATLDGTGGVGGAVITNSAVAPGVSASRSTLQINGNLTFNPGGILSTTISPSAASLVNVAGTATLTGASVNAQFASGSFATKSYTILTATSFVGAFTGVTSANLPAGFTESLSTVGNNVLLNLTATLGALSPVGLNPNQQKIATTLNTFFNNGGTLPPGFLTLFGLTGTNLGNALTRVSGETAVGSQQTTFNAMGQFMGVMTDPFIAGRGDGSSSSAGAAGYADGRPLGYAQARQPNDALAAIYTKAPQSVSFEQRWSVWTAGFGGSQTTDGNAATGSNNTSSSIAGTAVGADYRFSPDTIAGFALAGGGTNFSVANGGSGHSDLFQAGAFIRHNAGPAYISAALAYGWQDITTDRTVTIGGTELLRAQFDANAYSGRVEGGYRFVAPVIGGVGITPYAAGQFTTFDLPAYAESALAGASSFALSYASKDVTDPRSELGVRTDESFALQDSILTLRGRLAWAHDYDTDRSIASTFQALPGASFVVNGAAQAADSALVTASAEMKWSNGWSASVTFEGEFSNVTASYAGKGVVRYAW
jgi:uncharacterized protein with beta-barrel porin domain